MASWLPQVLYLGAASGTSVSHVSDIVGPQGTVYAVEFSHRSGELVAAKSMPRSGIWESVMAQALNCVSSRSEVSHNTIRSRTSHLQDVTW